MEKKLITIIVSIILLSIPFTGCLSNESNNIDNTENATTNAPLANFTISPSLIIRNHTIFFNSTSLPNQSPIINWTWNMGDGSILTGESIQYTYNTSGQYTVQLQIRDLDGYKDIIERTISVYKKPLLETVSLSTTDLHNGYIKYLESYNSTLGFNFSIPVSEVYNEQFIYEDYDNNPGFPLITTTFCRFNSTADAARVLQNSSAEKFEAFDKIIPVISTSLPEKFGNQSTYKLYQGKMTEAYEKTKATYSFHYFRVENIDVLILLISDKLETSFIDYQNVTTEYAKIIENRIQNYLLI